MAMRELRCPTCHTANAVKDPVDLHAVRCAMCEGSLDEQVHVRYLVDAGGLVAGPRIHRDLRKMAATGQLEGDVLLSEEGGPWFLAQEREDLFRIRPHRSVASKDAVRIPSSVLWMANLAAVMSGLLLLVGVLVGIFLADLVGRSEAFTAVVILFALGFGQAWMSVALRRGSRIARIFQLALAGLVGLGALSTAVQGMDVSLTLVALAFVAIPFLLLLNEAARAYFREE